MSDWQHVISQTKMMAVTAKSYVVKFQDTIICSIGHIILCVCVCGLLNSTSCSLSVEAVRGLFANLMQSV